MFSCIRNIISFFISLTLSAVMSIPQAWGVLPEAKSPEDYRCDNIKNVILLIGDGMGPLHLEKTKRDLSIPLAMDTAPLQGRSKTRSFGGFVTDSAAGGTALAVGKKVINGTVGVYAYDPVALESKPLNLTEFCHNNGMKTGIVTTDSTSGATPADFSAHTSSRSNTEDIDTQQLTSDIDLIWGGKSKFVTKEAAVANGFTFVTTYSEMEAVAEGERSFAQFEGDMWKLDTGSEDVPNLEQMTVKAIDTLDDTDKGFFLMVEGAHIDKHSHGNNEESMAEALAEFDRTVAAAADYAAEDGETLVVVTADHETGGIKQNADGSYSFTQTSHSGADVPLLVFGSDSFIENGEKIENCEIPKRIAYTLGYTENQFPKEIYKDWVLA